MAQPTNRAYHVGVQFNSSSGYTELRDRSLGITIVRQIADAFTPLAAGTAEIRLNNDDGVLSPDNTVSSYAGLMRPGLNVRIWGLYDTASGNITAISVTSVTNPASPPAGITNIYPLFTGAIDQWTIDPKLTGPREVTLQCRDLVKTLIAKNINVSLNTDFNITSLFTEVLSRAGITTSQRSVSTIDDTAKFSYFEPDTPASDALGRIVESGDYYFWVDGAGIVQVKDRNYTQGLAVTQSYSEFYDLNYALNDDNVANFVRISADPRQAATSVGTVAFISAPITIAGSSFASFFLDYLDPDTFEPTPANSMVTPVASTDYYTAANSDGSGTNRTSTTSVSATFFATTAINTVFNGFGSTIYLSRYQLRGLALQRRSSIVVERKNSSSQAVYGDRLVTIVNNLIGTEAYAVDYADYLLELRKNPVPALSVAPPANLWPDVFSVDLGTAINLVQSHVGLDSQYVIMGLEHQIESERDTQHVVTWTVERSRDFELLFLDDASLGLLDSRRLGS